MSALTMGVCKLPSKDAPPSPKHKKGSKLDKLVRTTRSSIVCKCRPHFFYIFETFTYTQKKLLYRNFSKESNPDLEM